jgi:RimJ/RimL family protein N-acetyltransferase
VQLLTARLRLRCLEEKDLDAAAAMLSDWEVAQWLSRPPYPYRRRDGEAFLAAQRAEHAAGRAAAFALAEAASDALVGAMGVEPLGEGIGELGYWLGRPYWGRGYASEAGAALVGRAWRDGLHGVTAVTDPENLRSRRVLEKLGFRLVAERPRDEPSRRGARTFCAYALARPRP